MTTNISCSSDCIYQKDGKCSLELIKESKLTPTKDCVYFVKNGT